MSEEQQNNTPEEPKSDNNVEELREEIVIAGNELVDKFKELVEEGNVRRLIIRRQDGDILIEVPLTASVIAGGAIIALQPWFAALGAFAAFFAKLRLEIVRVDDDGDDEKKKIDLE